MAKDSINLGGSARTQDSTRAEGSTRIVEADSTRAKGNLLSF